MQCLLIAYAKPIIDLHCKALASKLQATMALKQHQLMLKLCGWKENFITKHMGSIAANVVRKSGGHSRNNIHIIMDLARLLAPDRLIDLDKTRFWRG